MDEKKEKEVKKATTTKKKTAAKATTKKSATKATTAKKGAAKTTATKKEETVKSKPVKKNTKKTSTKKEAQVLDKKEEIKEETVFCGRCGKVLKKGEKCDCTVSKEIDLNIDTEAIKNQGKSILEVVLNVYRKPYDTCKEEVERKEIVNSIILLVLIALSMGLLISGLTYASFHLDIGTYGSVADYYEVPYFKIFVVWSVIAFIMSFLPVVLSHLAGTLFSKNKFSFTGLVNLYASSLSVVIFINVISAIFIFAGLFIKFFLLISLLTLLFGAINYLFVYRDLMSFDKSKETYIFLGIVLVWIIGLIVISSLFTSGVNGLNAFETIISTMAG